VLVTQHPAPNRTAGLCVDPPNQHGNQTPGRQNRQGHNAGDLAEAILGQKFGHGVHRLGSMDG